MHLDRVNELINTGWARSKGITGKGVTVAVVDTGIFLHEDFDKERIVGFYDCFGKNILPYDDCGHGTHVAGIIAGNGRASGGKYEGVAPGASLVVVKALDYRGDGKFETVIKALNKIKDRVYEDNIRIVNISMGAALAGRGMNGHALVEVVEKLWDMGVVVCVAAGNKGPAAYSVTMPGISPRVITVGFISQGENHCSKGPTKSCVVKPEIIAPGNNIVSCMNSPGKYTVKSGSSMATPIVSGAIALLLEMYPSMTNVQVKKRLYERTVDLGYDKNIQGWGWLDIKRLLC